MGERNFLKLKVIIDYLHTSVPQDRIFGLLSTGGNCIQSLNNTDLLSGKKIKIKMADLFFIFKVMSFRKSSPTDNEVMLGPSGAHNF